MDKSALKTSLVFLGAVGAATFAAHKFWPKGVTYGNKEDWEEEETVIRKVKRERQGEPPYGGQGAPPLRRPENGRYLPPPDERRYLEDRREPRGGRPEREDPRFRIPDERLLRVGQPDLRDGRLELAEARVGRGDKEEVEQVTVARLPSTRQRPPPRQDAYTTASVVSGSRSGDARRGRFVQDENRKSYYEAEEKVYRDDYGPSRYVEREREEFREVDRMPPARMRDDRAVPRYSEREDPDRGRMPRSRSDLDQPPFYDRGDCRLYVRQDDEYR
jgi:hypothetical protein